MEQGRAKTVVGWLVVDEVKNKKLGANPKTFTEAEEARISEAIEKNESMAELQRRWGERTGLYWQRFGGENRPLQLWRRAGFRQWRTPGQD